MSSSKKSGMHNQYSLYRIPQTNCTLYAIKKGNPKDSPSYGTLEYFKMQYERKVAELEQEKEETESYENSKWTTIC